MAVVEWKSSRCHSGIAWFHEWKKVGHNRDIYHVAHDGKNYVATLAQFECLYCKEVSDRTIANNQTKIDWSD